MATHILLQARLACSCTCSSANENCKTAELHARSLSACARLVCVQVRRQRKQLIIMSYDLMTKDNAKTLCTTEEYFRVVVCDESHYIKNFDVWPLTEL